MRAATAAPRKPLRSTTVSVRRTPDAPRPEDAQPLAAGPRWFTHCALHQPGQPPQRVPARDLPPEVLARLTAPRPALAGLSLDVPRIMGILNVTPDSFSDGGLDASATEAAARGRALLAAGADLLDIGAESTRPGAAEVPQAEELARLLPVLEAVWPRVMRSWQARDQYVENYVRFLALSLDHVEGSGARTDGFVDPLAADIDHAPVAQAFQIVAAVLDHRPVASAMPPSRPIPGAAPKKHTFISCKSLYRDTSPPAMAPASGAGRGAVDRRPLACP